MSKIAIWCRHKDDSVIGIGPKIPWHISSDFKRFKRITQGQAILVGQTTYESFENRTLPNRRIYVLSFLKDYQLSDTNNHFLLNDFSQIASIDETLYICGGASIYRLSMEALLPDVVVDSVYQGDLPADLTGPKIDVASCAEKLQTHYQKIIDDFELDNVITTVYARKDWVKDQQLIDHLKNAIFQK